MPTYDCIATTKLTSPAGTIEFTGLSNTGLYNTRIVIISRSTSTTTFPNLLMQLNLLSTGYNNFGMYGNGETAGGYGAYSTTNNSQFVLGATSSASASYDGFTFGTCVVDLYGLNYGAIGDSVTIHPGYSGSRPSIYKQALYRDGGFSFSSLQVYLSDGNLATGSTVSVFRIGT